MRCNNSDNMTEMYLREFRRILRRMCEEMHNAVLTDSISHNFIVQMIPHHEAAISMSRNLLKYTENKELAEIAENIISEQTKSIESMSEILNCCERCVNSCCEVREYNNNNSQIMRTMINEMRNALSDCCINCNFIREMIPHHMGGVQMSKNALCFCVCPELKPILEDIIISQEKGIRTMKSLSCHLGCR